MKGSEDEEFVAFANSNEAATDDGGKTNNSMTLNYKEKVDKETEYQLCVYFDNQILGKT